MLPPLYPLPPLFFLAISLFFSSYPNALVVSAALAALPTPCLKGFRLLSASGKSTAGGRAPALPVGVKQRTHAHTLSTETHLPMSSHPLQAPPIYECV